MSENIFEPLAASLNECSKTIIKSIKNVLNINTLDFKKLFEELNLCNKSKEYPRLYKILNEEHFKTYQFTVPIGLSIKQAVRAQTSTDGFGISSEASYLHR